MYISDAAFKSWMQADLNRVEQFLTEEIMSSSNPFTAHVLLLNALSYAPVRNSETWSSIVLCRADYCTPVYRDSTIRHWLYRACNRPRRHGEARVSHIVFDLIPRMESISSVDQGTCIPSELSPPVLSLPLFQPSSCFNAENTTMHFHV